MKFRRRGHRDTNLECNVQREARWPLKRNIVVVFLLFVLMLLTTGLFPHKPATLEIPFKLAKKFKNLLARIALACVQCDQNKSPNVYKSCPKMISLEKW